jgi:hypothetical protein
MWNMRKKGKGTERAVRITGSRTRMLNGGSNCDKKLISPNRVSANFFIFLDDNWLTKEVLMTRLKSSTYTPLLCDIISHNGKWPLEVGNVDFLWRNPTLNYWWKKSNMTKVCKTRFRGNMHALNGSWKLNTTLDGCGEPFLQCHALGSRLC